MKFAKKDVKIFLLVIGVSLLLVACSKNALQKNVDGNAEITGNAVEDSKENCRLSNESDCTPIEIKRGEPENEETNKTQENSNIEKASNKTIIVSEEDFVLTNCTESWKCVEKKYRAYQYTNCSWSSIEFCIYGCNESICRTAPICKLNSFKCDNDVLMTCGEDGYEWKVNESCDYRCENGACIDKNETLTNATNLTNTANLTNTTASTDTTQGNNFMLDSCMSVLNFNYAPAGNNLSNEYFTLKNSCSYSIDMSGWTAKDNSNHVYTFPSFNLGDAAQVSIVTGSGTGNSTTLYWGRSSAVWNNDGDTLYLNASNGTSVLIYSYP